MLEPENRVKKRNPYIGPRPFAPDDAYRFFGRDPEIADLCSLVASHRTVLLYSQSGAGKTSLLSAGVIPLLEQHGFEVLPTARVSGAREENLSSGIENVYVYNCRRFWGDDNVLPGASLTSMLATRTRHTDATHELLPRVAVFDQFEELFTAYPARWQQRGEFFTQLAEALATDPTLRVLFAMRGDFIAQLAAYEEMLPEELRTRYRLEQLRKEQALAAVERPLAETGIQFKPGVSELLVADLLSIASGEPGDMPVPGEFVDPVQLQVACFSLFENLPPGTSVITEAHLKDFGDLNRALREFYRDALRKTVNATGVDEDALRQWIEGKLITESGSRGLVFRGDKTTGGIENAAVEVMEELHIIRADVRGRDRWYELSHDRFIRPILRANDEWRARVKEQAERKARDEAAEEATKVEREAAQKRELEQAQALAHEQQLRAEESAAGARWLRRGIVVLAIMLAIAIIASLYALVQRRRAQEFAQTAQVEKVRAEEAAKREKDAKFYAITFFASLLRSAANRDLAQPLPPAVRPPIKHLIVLMMENRSFDHMLGALKAIDPRIDGLTGDESNPDAVGGNAKVQPLAEFQGQLQPDPDHHFPAVDLQIFGGDTSSGRLPNMQGFVKSYYNQEMDVRHSQQIMYYFEPNDLPVLTTLALEFAVCDHWFSSVPGPSIPNRAFAHYGTSYGHVDMKWTHPNGPYKSIYERMLEKGHTAKVYYYDAKSSTMEVPDLIGGHQELFGTYEQFLEDTKNGNLPEYSFVEPNFSDHESPSGEEVASDQHPGHHVQRGEIFIASVYQAIKNNPMLWESSVLLVTYSNHGGIYDHLPPPQTVRDAFVAQPDETGTGKAFAFDRLGVRVPAVIVSPWIPRGTVVKRVFDHASIPATVTELFLRGYSPRSPREISADVFIEPVGSLDPNRNILSLPKMRTDAPDFAPD